MINHARTLLLNAAAGSYADHGEEYVPAEFSPVVLPSALQTARRVLFGTAPDRTFLNLRCRELLQLVHETELAEFVYALDPRVTYWPERSAPLFGAPAKISIEPGGNQLSQMFVSGADSADAGSGKCARRYMVTVESSAVIVRLVTSGDNTTTALQITDGASQEISFPRSPLTFRLLNPGDGDTWWVETLVRPTPVVSTLMPVLELLGEPVFLELFGAAPAEPYVTFKNLWFDHPSAAHRLGGLLLALIYRTDAVRNKTNG
jgi:hypothetical protein